MIDAYFFFINKKHTTNGAKKDKDGNYQDEVMPFDEFAVWLYHGNPIALYEYETRRIYVSNCGWNTVTTKERLNSLPIPAITQKQFCWYQNGLPFEDKGEYIKARLKSVKAMDGNRPPFCIAYCSDNGEWEDAWYPHKKVVEEVNDIVSFLKNKNMKPSVSIKQTGNFCIRHQIVVPGNKWREAKEAMKSFDKKLMYAVIVEA